LGGREAKKLQILKKYNLNFILVPKDLDVKMKAVVLSATFLIVSIVDNKPSLN